MKRLISIAALVLAGCASEAEKAEAEYEIVAERSIDGRGKCAAARKVEAAHLRAGNVESYEHWNLIASTDCM